MSIGRHVDIVKLFLILAGKLCRSMVRDRKDSYVGGDGAGNHIKKWGDFRRIWHACWSDTCHFGHTTDKDFSDLGDLGAIAPGDGAIHPDESCRQRCAGHLWQPIDLMAGPLRRHFAPDGSRNT